MHLGLDPSTLEGRNAACELISWCWVVLRPPWEQKGAETPKLATKVKLFPQQPQTRATSSMVSGYYL